MEQNSPVVGTPGLISAPSAKLGRENMRLFLYGFVGLIGVVIVASVVVGMYRVYRQAATDPFTLAVARVLHLPALKVNGERVAYADYVSDLKAIKLFRDYSKSSGNTAVDFSDVQLSDQVLSRLVTNVVKAQAARRLKLSVSADDMTKLEAQLLAQFKTKDAINAELVKRYGWDLPTYERKVMQPYILETKLGEQLQSDSAARTALRTQAESVLQQLKNGADFAALAKQYGTDGTAAKGGDLGWFKKGDMVPQFEAAAFALKPGALSDIVESPYGYHLIKMEERRTTKTKDAGGKSVNQEEVHARHILFSFPTIDSFLTKELKDANIKIYINVHNPFVKLATSTTATP